MASENQNLLMSTVVAQVVQKRDGSKQQYSTRKVERFVNDLAKIQPALSDVNAQAKDGGTALMLAAKGGHAEVSALLEAAA